MEYIVKEVITNEERNKVDKFLSTFDLSYQLVDYTLYIEIDNNIIATVSSKQDIITSFAISKEFQEENIAGLLISKIINYLYSKGISHQFIYTKPLYRDLFSNLNFREIITTDQVCMLESSNKSITNELIKIKEKYHINENNIGCIVMNANPFTKGHLYLVEQAAKKHIKLVVFVLEENLSFFSFNDRFKLVQQGTNHLENVIVIPSTKYIISSITFPTYFLKEDVDAVLTQAKLDALIFKKYFMKIFNITKRYVGSETDLVTNKYNNALKDVLKDDLILIDRINVDEMAISASRVRKYIKEKNFIEIKKLVPPSTYQYLLDLVMKDG